MIQAKRAVVLVIDGLGVGLKDVDSPNTLQALVAHENSEKGYGETYRDLRGFMDSDAPFAGSSVVMPSYEGADSYKGHYEMIGVDVGKRSVFIEEYLDSIREVYPRIDEITKGVYVLQEAYYLSNNIEAELGTSVNLIGDLSKISWDELINEGRRISALLKCQRVIVMANHDITRACILRGVRSRRDIEESRIISGIIPSLCGLYDENYLSYHIGRALDSYEADNLIDLITQHGGGVVFVGKVGDIFQVNIDTATNVPAVTSEQTHHHIQQAMRTDASLIFGNFQQVDLMCHACRPDTGLKNLLEVCDYIDDIKSQLHDGDLLLVVADHGNDPSGSNNAHTRERVPLLAYGLEDAGVINKTYNSLSCVADIVKLHLGIT